MPQRADSNQIAFAFRPGEAHPAGNDKRWLAEESAYLDLWRRCYSLPARETIADWRMGGAQTAD